MEGKFFSNVQKSFKYRTSYFLIFPHFCMFYGFITNWQFQTNIGALIPKGLEGMTLLEHFKHANKNFGFDL